MVWEDWQGNERRVSFGELQDTSRKFANALRAHGVERGERVATLLPSLPETAAAFIGSYRAGAILLSLSVLYGDEGIKHRLEDSGAKVVVTNEANRDRIPIWKEAKLHGQNLRPAEWRKCCCKGGKSNDVKLFGLGV